MLLLRYDYVNDNVTLVINYFFYEIKLFVNILTIACVTVTLRVVYISSLNLNRCEIWCISDN